MLLIPKIRLIHLGQARDVTRGGEPAGVPEIDFTLIRPMG